MVKSLNGLAPGDKVRGVVCECENCDELFIARKVKRFCSKTCKRFFHRRQEVFLDADVPAISMEDINRAMRTAAQKTAEHLTSENPLYAEMERRRRTCSGT